MCHIAGGGSEDFFPGLAQAVGGTFSAEWRETSTRVRDGLQSTTFIYKFNKRLTMILTRPKAPNGAKDRVQVIATLNYKLQD